MKKELCNIEELSKYINMSIPYIRKQVRAKRMPCYRLGNRLKFDLKEINEWIENNKIEQRKNVILF